MDLHDLAAMMSSQLHRASVPLERQLDTLKRLNVSPAPALAEALQADPSDWEEQPYTALLSRMAREGSPQVLFVDSEAAAPETMYRDLFARLAALSGGEAALEGVQEAPGAGAEGACRVTFALNGRPYAFDAAPLGSWLDPEVFPFLNAALEEAGLRKRFVTVDDARLQGLLVFYRTPEWARFFAAGTGLTVRDS